MTHKSLRMVFVIVIVSVLGGGVYLIYSLQQRNSISNYDECVAAGNPIFETFPERCTANNRMFIND